MNATWNNSLCSGIWPYGANDSVSQSIYQGDCYGHDEPGIQFYSSLPGSGGNVSWDVTLPIDRSPSLQQGNLYVAIWFGLTLADPRSWLNECFLELQFYPDQSWTQPIANGNWIGAAVAWQIEASSGQENPCFYQQLLLSGSSSAFNMNQGDQITVRMTGWAGDPSGEHLDIRDDSSGQASSVYLVDPVGNIPIDPAYPTNSFQNGLQWTPGGEFPVVFAFETGHGANATVPSNNSYGGCSPGPPPPTQADPAVPCPSYDSGSWANHTLAPWRIQAPTFFNASANSVPTQVAFGQDFGGFALVGDLSNGACSGRSGASWCSYPWYSYSCAIHAFEFGATDFPGVTEDFGKFLQYGSIAQKDGPGFGFYPPHNASIPSCGAPSSSVSVSSTVGGTVHFLSTVFPPNGTVSGLAAGNYSIRATPRSGFDFLGWSTNGGAAVTSPGADPWANLVVTGNGSVIARFGRSAPTTSISFAIEGSTVAGSMAMTDSELYDGAPPIARLTQNGTVALHAGVYGIEAFPPPGYLFTGWTASAGLELAAPPYPYTWLVVTGGVGSATLNASFGASPAHANLTWGSDTSTGGTVHLGTASTTTSMVSLLRVGSYELAAVPAAGYAFAYWVVYGNAETIDQGPVTNVTLEGYNGYAYAYFAPKLGFHVLPARGTISVDGSAGYGNTSSTTLSPGWHTITSLPGPGAVFSSWSVSNGSAAWVQTPGAPSSSLELNASADLTLTLSTSLAGRLSFRIVPLGAGHIVLDGGTSYANGSVNATLGRGSLLVVADPGPAYTFASWTTSGAVTVTSGAGGTFAVVSGTTGILTARFTAFRVAVSFVAVGVPSASIVLNGTRFGSGSTILLDPGTYPIALTLPVANATFDGWWPTTGLTVLGRNVSVAGPGTLLALIAPFLVRTPNATPSSVLRNGTVLLTENAAGPPALTYVWVGLPGCASSNLSNFYCTPSRSGTFGVSVVVIDPEGDSAESGTVAVIVDAPALAASVTASPSQTDVGVASTIRIVVTAGLAPFTFSYQALPPGCIDQNTSVLSCLPVGPSNGTTVRVDDHLGLSAALAVPLDVHPRPTLAVARPSAWAVDAGLRANLALVERDGTAPFHYQWTGLPPGCLTADNASLSCASARAGNYLVTVRLLDAVGVSAQLNVTLAIAALPRVTSFLFQPNATDVGVPVNATVGILGGTGPWSLSYVGLPSGCASANLSLLRCAPTVAGSNTVIVTVQDKYGLQAAGTSHVSVNPLPGIAAAFAHPSSILVGATVSLEVEVTGGTPAFRFAFTGLPPGCATSNAPGISCTPTTSGAFSIGVTVTDALGKHANATIDLGVASPPPAPPMVPWGWIAGGAAVVIAIGATLFALLRARRRRQAGELEATA